jgi:sec-independent protein translocase protein TatC
MTLVEHLTELRRRLIVSVLGISGGAVVVFALYNRVFDFLIHPYCGLPHTVHLGPGCSLPVLGPLDGFSLRLNIAAWGGLILALPIVLWQLWRFITPGLHAREKRYTLPFVLASLAFFALGGVIAWITLPHALRFLVSIGGPHLTALYQPSTYLHLVIALMVIFGIAFEFPVVLVSLQAAHVVTPDKLRQWRKRAIMMITVFAGVATPSSDPFSMLALLGPMLLFYEMSILVGRMFRH